MQIPFVDLKAQYKTIKKEVDSAILQVVKNTNFILGPECQKFEEEYKKFCQSAYAVGVDSGISALELGMRALGIGPGDEVITPANSFIASSSAISFTGATPVLVDCDLSDFNIDVNKIEEKITKKTKAIMPVHLYGQMAGMDRILKIAKKHKLFVIEDACQAHGADYFGKRAGSLGTFAAFSFYPGKNLGAYGDAGMLVTSNKKIYEMISAMRNYGQIKKYHHNMLAWNRRLDNIQAAILSVKLKHLKTWNDKRLKNAKFYNRVLKNTPLVLPVIDKNRKHVFHLYVVRCPDNSRDKLMQYLKEAGIDTGIHYPVPIHLQKAYAFLDYKKGDFPITEKLSSEILSLPMYPELTESQIEFIADKVRSFYNSAN